MSREFKDIFISRELQYTIGIDMISNKYFISFPQLTRTRQGDYEVYYWLPAEYEVYIKGSPDKVYEYVIECIKGYHQTMLIE